MFSFISFLRSLLRLVAHGKQFIKVLSIALCLLPLVGSIAVSAQSNPPAAACGMPLEGNLQVTATYELSSDCALTDQIFINDTVSSTQVAITINGNGHTIFTSNITEPFFITQFDSLNLNRVTIDAARGSGIGARFDGSGTLNANHVTFRNGSLTVINTWNVNLNNSLLEENHRPVAGQALNASAIEVRNNYIVTLTNVALRNNTKGAAAIKVLGGTLITRGCLSFSGNRPRDVLVLPGGTWNDQSTGACVGEIGNGGFVRFRPQPALDIDVTAKSQSALTFDIRSIPSRADQVEIYLIPPVVKTLVRRGGTHWTNSADNFITGFIAGGYSPGTRITIHAEAQTSQGHRVAYGAWQIRTNDPHSLQVELPATSNFHDRFIVAAANIPSATNNLRVIVRKLNAIEPIYDKTWSISRKHRDPWSAYHVLFCSASMTHTAGCSAVVNLEAGQSYEVEMVAREMTIVIERAKHTIALKAAPPPPLDTQLSQDDKVEYQDNQQKLQYSQMQSQDDEQQQSTPVPPTPVPPKPVPPTPVPQRSANQLQPSGPYADLIRRLIAYEAEDYGDAHKLRWKRALAALGWGSHDNPMTLQEAKNMRDQFTASRWQPVVDALRALQPQPTNTPVPPPPPPPGEPEPEEEPYTVPQSLINTLKGYQGETQHGDAHVERWTRALAALGSGSHDSPLTLQQAKDMAKQFTASRWQPVIDALEQLAGD